jgi:hypothetical protein
VKPTAQHAIAKLRFLALPAVVLVALSLTTAPAALASGDANRLTCPQATEASPGFRTYLSDCRAYELMTPPFKGGTVVGGGTRGTTVSSNGDHVVVIAGGAFAGAGNYWFELNRNPFFDAYALTRSATGWTTTSLTPPATEFPFSTFLAASDTEDLNPTLWGAEKTTVSANEDIYLRTAAGEFRLVGPGIGPEVRGEPLEDFSYELEFAGGSADLSHHAIFTVEAFTEVQKTAAHGHSNLWPGDTTKPGKESLYEYSYDGAPASEPLLVGITNQGPVTQNSEAHLISSCGTMLGSASQLQEKGSDYNAVSESGETVYFTAAACEGGPAVNELYARLSASTSVSVSEPAPSDCEICDTTLADQKDATFEGASSDGEKAFFLTEQSLIPGQEGQNLYEYDFDGPASSPQHPTGKITDVTGGVKDPEVQGVTRVSNDGKRVYFVAKGILSGENHATGSSPVGGGDNLYVYDTEAGTTQFVGCLLTATEKESIKAAERAEEASLEAVISERLELGEASVHHMQERGEITAEQAEAKLLALQTTENTEYKIDFELQRGSYGPKGTLREDALVWSQADERPAQATGDGEYLVFPSSAHLTGEVIGTIPPQLYEYDAVTEAITRVSGSTTGDSGGVETFHDAAKIPLLRFAGEMQPGALSHRRALSEDGSRVFFDSSAPLASGTVAGATNVFEFNNGRVFLISDGSDASKYESEPVVHFAGIDPEGDNALFFSTDPLVPQASETDANLYDAREGGGLAEALASAGCDGGETCRGTTIAPPVTPMPGTADQPGELLATVNPQAVPKAAPTPIVSPAAKKLTAAAKRCRRTPRRRRAKCLKASKRRRSGRAANARNDRRPRA